MNIRKELDRELSDMTFSDISGRTANISISEKAHAVPKKHYGKGFTAAVLSAAAVLTLGVSVAAVYSISGLAGKNIRDITAEDCAELDGYAAQTQTAQNTVTVKSVLYDGKLFYANLTSDIPIETLAISKNADYTFDSNDGIQLPGVVDTSEEDYLRFVCGRYGGGNFSVVFYSENALDEGDTFYIHTMLSDNITDTVTVTVPKTAEPKKFTMANADGDSFDITVTPLSLVCSDSGRLYESFGGKKYHLPFLLLDKDGKVIYSRVANGSLSDENDYIVAFDTVANTDIVDSVRIGDYYSK